jgi:uncharacterized protein (DUF302 family)
VKATGSFIRMLDSLGSKDGLTTIPSSFDPKETDRLQTEIRARGMTIFARIDHAAGAAEVGLTLRPTELIIFGNARGGPPLMQAAQTAGIDLPLKMLVCQDPAHKTWVSYNEPGWIAQRHRVTESEPAVMKMAAALSAIATKVTTAQ